MQNRRGQMEMLGLAIIMVIVMIGVLLALQFFFLKVPKDPTQAARDKQLGANLLDSMLETTSDCRNVPLLTLLQDCARGPNIQNCPGDNVAGIEGGNSCVHAKSTIGFMLNQTLETWGRRYIFDIVGNPNVEMQFKNADCEEYETIERIHPVGGATLKIVLRLCR